MNRLNRETPWRSVTPQPLSPSLSGQTFSPVHASAPSPPPVASPSPTSSSLDVEQPSTLKDLEELRRPAFVEHQARLRSQKKANTASVPKDKKSMKTDINQTDERSWMKIVKLSQEEQDELER